MCRLMPGFLKYYIQLYQALEITKKYRILIDVVGIIPLFSKKNSPKILKLLSWKMLFFDLWPGFVDSIFYTFLRLFQCYM